MPKQIPDAQILSAAVEVIIEQGFHAATTKQIAARAGINEVTLFRRFGSKADLLREALAREAQAFVESVRPSGDLQADLERIVVFYVERIRKIGPLVPIVLGELRREPSLALVIAEPRRMALGVAELIAHYQRIGLLEPEPPLQAVLALLGPLLISGMLGQAVDEIPQVRDFDEYVRRYLHGRSPSTSP